MSSNIMSLYFAVNEYYDVLLCILGYSTDDVSCTKIIKSFVSGLTLNKPIKWTNCNNLKRVIYTIARLCHDKHINESIKFTQYINLH